MANNANGPFNIVSNGVTGVSVIGAGATGLRPRFLILGFTNLNLITAHTVTFYDGTAAAGTARFQIGLPASKTEVLYENGHLRGAIPKNWFTAANDVQFKIDGGGVGTDVQVWGDYVMEV